MTPLLPVTDPGVEDALRQAVFAYVNVDLPGAERTSAYNAQRVEYRMHEEDDPSNTRLVERVIAERPPPGRLLELGVGTGGLCVAFARAGYAVAGVEPLAAGVDAARLRAKRYPGAEIRVEKGVAEALPFPDASFDLVVSTSVIEHVPDQLAGARECLRVLVPGGVVVHKMPNYAFPREGHYRIWWPPRASRRVGRLYLRAIGRDTRLFDEHIFPTTPQQILGVFRQAGFAGVEDRYAAEIAGKLDRGDINLPALRPLMPVLKATRLLGLVRRGVMALEMYPTIFLVGRKPG